MDAKLQALLADLVGLFSEQLLQLQALKVEEMKQFYFVKRLHFW
jgi:hypothetical protein